MRLYGEYKKVNDIMETLNHFIAFFFFYFKFINAEK